MCLWCVYVCTLDISTRTELEFTCLSPCVALLCLTSLDSIVLAGVCVCMCLWCVYVCTLDISTRTELEFTCLSPCVALCCLTSLDSIVLAGVCVYVFVVCVCTMYVPWTSPPELS